MIYKICCLVLGFQIICRKILLYFSQRFFFQNFWNFLPNFLIFIRLCLININFICVGVIKNLDNFLFYEYLLLFLNILEPFHFGKILFSLKIKINFFDIKINNRRKMNGWFGATALKEFFIFSLYCVLSSWRRVFHQYHQVKNEMDIWKFYIWNFYSFNKIQINIWCQLIKIFLLNIDLFLMCVRVWFSNNLQIYFFFETINEFSIFI